MGENVEAAGPQHGLRAGDVRRPPVGGIIRITVLDEMQLGIIVPEEDVPLAEGIVLRKRRRRVAAPRERMEDQQIARRIRAHEIEREHGIAQVVQHAHEQHHVERLAERAEVIHGHALVLDVGAAQLRREARLRQIAFV